MGDVGMDAAQALQRLREGNARFVAHVRRAETLARQLLRAQARTRSGHSVTAGEVMTREVETITPDTAVRHAINRLLDDKFGCLPVVDGQGRLVGIFTDSDAARLAGRLLAERDNARSTGGAEGHAP